MERKEIFDIVRETRDMLMPHWGNVEEWKKDDGTSKSVVTALDLAVERYLADKLKILDPGVGFVGEESGGSRDAQKFWLCDPIDGTAHFVRGLPFCSVMLALIEDGKVTLSVIYDFVHDELYHAARGEGAYKDSERISVSTRPMTDSYLSLEARLRTPQDLQVRERLIESAMLLSSITSGYEFCLVASGKIEGRICLDPWGKDYDFAPGTLLVEEAGGVVANIGSSSYDFRDVNLIAANPIVYRALTEGPDAFFPLRS